MRDYFLGGSTQRPSPFPKAFVTEANAAQMTNAFLGARDALNTLYIQLFDLRAEARDIGLTDEYKTPRHRGDGQNFSYREPRWEYMVAIAMEAGEVTYALKELRRRMDEKIRLDRERIEVPSEESEDSRAGLPSISSSEGPESDEDVVFQPRG